ncbi:MAG TPA: TonB-dependent receptor [Opitutus sp.]|nr:TonB-dependent receptor [Opitutus sp.]
MNKTGPFLAGILLLASVGPLAAQTTAPDQEEVILLSPFEVRTASASDYIASESVTGSRVATPIKDLPFSINVITSEFLNDFDFIEIDSNMAYTSSLTGLDTQGNYNLRGYGATFQLRNGFYRLGLIDRVNVDRVEVIKGPNAAIYGQTSPAGLVNIISKRPPTKHQQRASVMTGSNDLLRGEINVGGPLGSWGATSFSHLLSASAMDRDSDIEYATMSQRTFSEAVLAKLGDRTTLLAEFEYSQRNSIPATNDVPLVVTRSGNRYTYTSEFAKEFARLSQNGPNAQQDRQVSTGTVTLEHQFNPVFSARVSGYVYGRNAVNFNSSTGDQYYPVTRVIMGRNPTYSHLNEDGGALQADLLAHYWTNNRNLEHKTLLTFDWSSNWRRRIETKPLTSVLGSTDVNVDNPNYAMPARPLWNIVTRNDRTRNDVVGVYLRQQTAFLQGRLIAFGGVRYDHVKFNLDFGDQYNVGGSKPGSLRAAGTTDRFTDTAVSPNVGLNYKLTPNVALFANFSRSFFPNAQASKLGDPRLPNERAKGFDYGIKAGYFQDRLVFTLSAFSIERNGVKATIIEDGTAVDRAAGQQKADGVELDFTWRVTDNLTLLGGYGYTDARISDNGRDVDSVGRRPSGVPQDNGGLAIRYRLPGALRGFTLTGGFKYLGEASPFSLVTVSGGNPDLARRNIEIPSSYTVDAGLSYTWRQRERGFSHTVRASVRNLFDSDDLTIRAQLPEGRQFFVSYTFSH